MSSRISESTLFHPKRFSGFRPQNRARPLLASFSIMSFSLLFSQSGLAQVSSTRSPATSPRTTSPALASIGKATVSPTVPASAPLTSFSPSIGGSTIVVLGFDTAQCLEPIEDYYAGGFGGDGSGPGPDYGVVFSPNALVLTDAALDACGDTISHVTNEPSFPNSLIFLSGSAATMNVAAGFTDGFAFYYAAPFDRGFINVWSGLNGTGVLLATLQLPLTGGCAENPKYCIWNPVGIFFSGIARSVDFGGTANYIAFDNITLGTSFVVNPGKSLGDSSDEPGSCHCGDPITIGIGNLFQSKNDYTTVGANTLAFTRYYNSLETATFANTLGSKWRSNYDRYLRLISSSTITAERPDGQQVNFNLADGAWTPDSDVDLKLTQNGSTWILVDKNDTIETYTALNVGEALLSSIQSRNGYNQTLQYNASNQLVAVSDSYHRTLNVTYSNGLLHTLTTPDNTVLTYTYTSSGITSAPDRLASVIYSTIPETNISYLYGDAALPLALTGIVDETGARYAAWSYDSFGRVLSSAQGTDEDLTSVAYNNSDGSRTVTNAAGQQTVYKFSTLQSVPKITEIDRLASATTSAASRFFTYDSNGYVASSTDWDGALTTYANDRHGQPTQIVEASGSPQARTTSITYHSVYHLPLNIVTAGLTTTFAYDVVGDLLTHTETDTTATIVPYSTKGTTKTWTFTWSDFLLASIRGPRTDVPQLTKLAYDSSGTLTGMTNPLNQTFRVTEHLPGGLPQTIVDPNGATTRIAYDGRLSPVSQALNTSVGALTTTWTYDAAEKLTKITLPDGSSLDYGYDSAHRLVSITDLFGQKITYTLNELGEPTQTNISNSSGTVTAKRSATYDALGQVLQSIGGVGQTSAFSYDGNGNALTITDPDAHLTQQAFDPLNRLIRTINAANGVAKAIFDAHDRPVTVVDPNSGTTTEVYDGFGNLIQQISPDAGKTVYRYDLAGNVVQKVDGTGAITNFTYDALNRLLTKSYPADSAENITNLYDESGHGFGVGRLTSLSDATGTPAVLTTSVEMSWPSGG